MSNRQIVTFAATVDERREAAAELHAYADRLGREKSSGAKKRADRMREIASTISGINPLEASE